ncbi:hypothetical protein VTI74DRAFT_11332 [Chaetomium olivicolor]
MVLRSCCFTLSKGEPGGAQRRSSRILVTRAPTISLSFVNLGFLCRNSLHDVSSGHRPSRVCATTIADCAEKSSSTTSAIERITKDSKQLNFEPLRFQRFTKGSLTQHPGPTNRLHDTSPQATPKEAQWMLDGTGLTGLACSEEGELRGLSIVRSWGGCYTASTGPHNVMEGQLHGLVSEADGGMDKVSG